MSFVYCCLNENSIKIFVCFYTYTFYVLLKDAFEDKVRILYTDNDSFFLHFVVEDLAKEINSHLCLQDAFDFSEISNGHVSNLVRGKADLHAKEVGYFKDET